MGVVRGARVQSRSVQRLGAIPLDGSVEFRAWAPSASALAVRLDDATHALEETGAGVFEGEARRGPGDDYATSLDGGEDCCPTRWLAFPAGGHPRIVDTSLRSDSARLRRRPLDELVALRAARRHLHRRGHLRGGRSRTWPASAELGVTAIELMPVATFPGDRGWGYDGHLRVRAAPGLRRSGRPIPPRRRRARGRPRRDPRRRLQPRRPRQRGTDRDSGRYHRDVTETPWGAGDRTSPRTVCASGRCRTRSSGSATIHLDGLRLDAVIRIHDDREPHLLRELADRVRAVDPNALLIVEMQVGDLRPIEEWGHDAQWADEFHHELARAPHRRAGGDYCAATARPTACAASSSASLAAASSSARRTTTRSATARSAIDRRPSAAPRAGAGLTVLAPQIAAAVHGRGVRRAPPLPVLHRPRRPVVADATRAGRRREFADFSGFAAEDVPDPQASPRSSARSSRASAIRSSRRSTPTCCSSRRGLPREVEVEVDEPTAHGFASDAAPSSSSRTLDPGSRRGPRQLRGRPERLARPPFPLGARWDGRARTSRSSPRTPTASSSVSSTPATRRRVIAP